MIFQCFFDYGYDKAVRREIVCGREREVRETREKVKRNAGEMCGK